jgi:DNA-binding Lrp family transcriptional regulator
MPDEQARTEEHRISGDRLVDRVRELVREGNVRRIKVKNDEGRTLLEIPLTIGVVGVALIPVWVALGAIAALAANYTLEIERGRSGPPAAP